MVARDWPAGPPTSRISRNRRGRSVTVGENTADCPVLVDGPRIPSFRSFHGSPYRGDDEETCNTDRRIVPGGRYVCLMKFQSDEIVSEFSPCVSR